MLRIAQQAPALSLVGSFPVRLHWAPSVRNPADGPSRGQVKPGPFKREWSPCEVNHSETDLQCQIPPSEKLESECPGAIKGSIVKPAKPNGAMKKLDSSR